MSDEMIQHKYGRLPARRLGMRPLASSRSSDDVGPLPLTFAAPSVGQWSMDANDQYGDCTIASVAHTILAWNARYKHSTPVPTTEQIVETYFSLTGGQDTGLVEADVLTTWKQQGLFDNRIELFAPVRNLPDEIKESIFLAGVCYLGINLPRSVEIAFSQGEPWEFEAGSPILGGHCIVAVGWNLQYCYAVTWGEVVKVSWKFLEAYCEEAWAIFGPQEAKALPPARRLIIEHELESVLS
jgi:hypothetical protein